MNASVLRLVLALSLVFATAGSAAVDLRTEVHCSDDCCSDDQDGHCAPDCGDSCCVHLRAVDAPARVTMVTTLHATPVIPLRVSAPQEPAPDELLKVPRTSQR
ncbi:MAG: hypothetical protein QM817_19705 [Archangium sp.]